MGKLFNLDNPVMQALSRLFDLALLNIIYVITCIPIITIGTATTAMYYVLLKVARGEEPYIIKNYFKSFKENFKQATIVWFIVGFAWVIIGFDFYFISTMVSDYKNIFMVIFSALAILCFCITLYIFPTIARFSCSTKQVFKNAVVFTFGHFPKTLIILAFYVFIFFAIFYSVETVSFALIAFPLAGFSVMAYATSTIIKTVFKYYEPEE